MLFTGKEAPDRADARNAQTGDRPGEVLAAEQEAQRSEGIRPLAVGSACLQRTHLSRSAIAARARRPSRALVARRLGCDGSTPTWKSSARTANRSPRSSPTTASRRFANSKPRSSPTCARTRLVVSTGGGAVLREANRAAMQAAGRRLAHRERRHDRRANRRRRRNGPSAAPTSRPSAAGPKSRPSWPQRTPIYRACATFEVDTEGKDPAAVADEIVAKLPPAPP